MKPPQPNRFLALAKALRPPPTMTVSQWAEQYRYTSPEASSDRGKWRNRPFQAEPMDCLSPSHPCHVVVLMMASQVMKTEIGLNWLGYIIHMDPGPALFVYPKGDATDMFSKDRLAPMLRDTPVLKGRVADARARNSDNTIESKRFTGGQISIVSPNSPTNLAGRPIRYLFCDEVDRYKASSGTEGDPITLAMQRTSEFSWNYKALLASSPTIKGSKIEQEYEASDQRKPYVPCPLPECGEFQVLYFDRLEWPEGKPKEAAYRCVKCQQLIPSHKQPLMLARGEWRATNPASDIPGFWISQMYSTRKTWGDLAREFLKAKKDPENLKAFTNTVLAQPWEDQHEKKIDHHALAGRCEHYSVLPPEVAVLTLGVDTQDNRLEASLWGWGRDEESWSFRHFIIPGDPDKPDVWRALDAILTDEYEHESGLTLRIAACCIDSAGGHEASVYRFTKERNSRRVWATKGRAGEHPVWPRKISRGGKERAPLYLVGVDAAKNTIYSRLTIQERGPGYVHFPNSVEHGPEFFEQLTSERKHFRYRNGYRISEWRKDAGVRNEVLDCAVYAYAALHGLYAGGFRLNREAERLALQAQTMEQLKADLPHPVAVATPGGNSRVVSRMRI